MDLCYCRTTVGFGSLQVVDFLATPKILALCLPHQPSVAQISLYCAWHADMLGRQHALSRASCCTSPAGRRRQPMRASFASQPASGSTAWPSIGNEGPPRFRRPRRSRDHLRPAHPMPAYPSALCGTPNLSCVSDRRCCTRAASRAPSNSPAGRAVTQDCQGQSPILEPPGIPAPVPRWSFRSLRCSCSTSSSGRAPSHLHQPSRPSPA